VEPQQSGSRSQATVQESSFCLPVVGDSSCTVAAAPKSPRGPRRCIGQIQASVRSLMPPVCLGKRARLPLAFRQMHVRVLAIHVRQEYVLDKLLFPTGKRGGAPTLLRATGNQHLNNPCLLTPITSAPPPPCLTHVP